MSRVEHIGRATPKMSDESLAAFLELSDKEAAAFFPQLTPEERAVYERMAEIEIDLNMGVTPEGVIVCRPKGCCHAC